MPKRASALRNVVVLLPGDARTADGRSNWSKHKTWEQHDRYALPVLFKPAKMKTAKLEKS